MPEPRRRGGASRGALGGTPAGAGRDWALRPVSVGILVVLLALTAVATWLTRAAVRSQESRLLAERAREVALVLDSSIGLVPTSLDSIGAVLRATNASPSAFATAASSEEAAGKGRITLALLRPAPGGYDVVAEAGPALVVG
ncbi:MAG: hypothetical protein ACRDYD_13250, partial [Acidimicrobiales bacterium]